MKNSFFHSFFFQYIRLNAKWITSKVFLNDAITPLNNENNWEILYGCGFVLMENDKKSK